MPGLHTRKVIQAPPRRVIAPRPARLAAATPAFLPGRIG